MARLSNHYILILCGGTGPRLWPLSRGDHPKQFLSLLSAKSLLQETFYRALKIVPLDHIYVISQSKYISLIKKDLAGYLDKHHLIVEPEKKNTSMAILLGCAVIEKQCPQAVITTFTSDHYIGQINLFKQNLIKAYTIALSSNYIVTLGIKPTSANPAYGYILAKTIPGPVDRFIEKPQPSTAKNLIKLQARWNSGIYTFKINTLLNEFALLQPNYYRLYQKLIVNLKNLSVIKKIYRLAENLAIDKSISEKSRRLYLLPAEFSWNDIGEWKSIFLQLSNHSDRIITLKPNTSFIQINSKKCLLSGPPKKLIGLINVNNLAIIDTPDALLICNLADNSSYQVRDLISKIVTNKKTQHYFLKSYDR